MPPVTTPERDDRRRRASNIATLLPLAIGMAGNFLAVPPPPRAAATAAPADIETAGVWFQFDPDFIRNKYRSEDVAFGSFTISTLWKAGPLHDETCGGEDAEVHIGVYEEHLGLDTSELPYSGPVSIAKRAWGSVIEPPNVTGDEETELIDLQKKAVTFDGYFRVWNEEHFRDLNKTKNLKFGDSNPNHILELHPAWKLKAQGSPDRVYDMTAMTEYHGYGMSKVASLLKAFADKKYPTIYQDGEFLYVHLPTGNAFRSNFYQFPVKILQVTTVGDAIVMRADVCATQNCSGTPIYRNLRLVTKTGTDEGDAYSVNERTTVLGLFSVNLRKALSVAPEAETEEGAEVHNEALEFFVFGRAKTFGVKNSDCEPDVF